MSIAGVTVVVVPRAKANGPLQLGQLAGPYLAADIAARAARARGERVLTVGGFDVHQNCVLTRAETDGVDVDKLISAYRDEIIDALGRFPLRRLTLLACEYCGRTLHHSYVVGMCACCGSEASGGGCGGCGGYTTADNLVGPRCDRCGGPPQPFRARVPVLSMEDYRQELIEIWLRAELSDHARQIVTRHLERRLPDVPLAYPTNWGVAGIGPHEGLRLDACAEVALSTLYGVAQSLRPGALGLEETAQAWSEVGSLWHFNGIDDVFYSALFWPAVYLACGVPPEAIGGALVNEFSTLDKASTSQGHTICANDFLHDEDVDILRLYLAWNHPDRYASEFTLSSHRQFEAYVRPPLDGATKDPALPAALAEAAVQRGAAALRPHGFDPALAVRAALSGLAAGASGAEQLLSVLIGR